jgi:hypothetical protein
MSGWDVRDFEASVGIGYSEVGSLQNEHYGAHLRMNVAENVRNPRLSECNSSSASTLVQPQVKGPALIDGERVMEKWIAIWKFNSSPSSHSKNVWREFFVLL